MQGDRGRTLLKNMGYFYLHEKMKVEASLELLSKRKNEKKEGEIPKLQGRMYLRER